MTEGPAADRLSAVLGTPSGWIVPSGLREFRNAIGGAENATEFNKWRQSPFTKLLYVALQDAILHPGLVPAPDVAVQFGVTQGLAFAAQLISDPTVLWPNAFGPGMENARPSTGRPSERFSSSPDGGGSTATATTK